MSSRNIWRAFPLLFNVKLLSDSILSPLREFLPFVSFLLDTHLKRMHNELSQTCERLWPIVAVMP
jgi:hypothetical protein